VYSRQHYVIKFVSNLWQVCVFSDIAVSSTNKTDRHDIAKILLKVALYTINPNTVSNMSTCIYSFLVKYKKFVIPQHWCDSIYKVKGHLLIRLKCLIYYYFQYCRINSLHSLLRAFLHLMQMSYKFWINHT